MGNIQLDMQEMFFQSYTYMHMLSHFSRVQLFATYGLQPTRILCLWDFSGKNTRMGCHFILQGIFLTQDETRISYVSCINRQVLYHQHHLGSPIIVIAKSKVYRNFVAQSCPTFCDPMNYSTQASMSFTISQSLLKFMSILLMMPSNNLILCHSFLLLPSIFPSIRVFSNELAVV